MDGLSFLFLVIIGLGIIGLIYAGCYNSLQNYLIKINEVESKIDSVLRERFDFLNKAADFIKENIKKDVMTDLADIKKDELSSFELDRKLVSITGEFYELKIINRDLVKIEEFTNIDFSLRENEATLDGFTAYYNDNIKNFNRLIRIFPSNIVAKLSGLKEKTFYDGKNMNDKNINDFKI